MNRECISSTSVGMKPDHQALLDFPQVLRTMLEHRSNDDECAETLRGYASINDEMMASNWMEA